MWLLAARNGDLPLCAGGRLSLRETLDVDVRAWIPSPFEETAAVLKISPQSVMRDWKLAKAWMALQLGGKAGGMES
jgi:ECF sigma factor